MEEESVLIQRTLAGDEAAFTSLVETYQNAVYNLAYRMLGDSAEADDAAQETFLRLYTRLRTYDPDRKFSSWLLSIASHYCIDRLRRRKHTQVSLDDDASSWRWLPSKEEPPEEVAIRGEQSEEIKQLLEQLPAHYRAVMVLRYWHDMSYEEIAATLGATIGTVKSRLHRARKVLVDRISAQRAQRSAELEDRRLVNNAVL
jgi:RNA polymerase sigma-70 factor (ECF subfamily)